MILSDFRGPGVHFGGLGPHFEDISDFCDFEDASGANAPPPFEVKINQKPIAVLFFNVFLSAHFS